LVSVEASVVIPVHNAEATLARQLTALAHQHDAPEFEVIVVLNRCTDGSDAATRRFVSQLNLRVIEANGRESAAHARNAGAAASLGEFLLFCDADDRVENRWVGEVVSPLRQRVADFVGGRIVVDRNGLPDWLYRWRYEFFDGECIRFVPSALPYAISASLACTREAFFAVDGFDEDFPQAGFEERDFGARLLRAGYRIGEAPGAVVSYSPQKNVRAALRQAKRRAAGQVVFAAKEGPLGPRPSLSDLTNALVRRAGYLVVRQREWRPRVLLCELFARYYQHSAHRRFLASGFDRMTMEPTSSDFAIPPSIPLIGGLAFQAPPSRAYTSETARVGPWSLAVIDALLPTGGVLVDSRANVGAFSVAAARRAGPTGRVLAFESDPRTRSVLEANLRRHRVRSEVDVREEAVGLLSLRDVIDCPIDMIRVDLAGSEASVLDEADRLLQESPHALLLVELNPAALRTAGRSIDDLFRLLPLDRWDAWLVDDRGQRGLNAIRVFDEAAASELAAAPSSGYANLLAVSKDRSAHVRDVLTRL